MAAHDYITAEQVAQRLGVSVVYARRLVKKNEEALGSFKFGRQVRIPVANFLDLFGHLQVEDQTHQTKEAN